MYETIAELYKADPRGNGIKTSSAPEELYKVYEDCEQVSAYKANFVHDIVAKNLYIAERKCQIPVQR